MTDNIDRYFENGKGFNASPFRKGYLTDEERKQPFRWFGDNFVFFAKNADLYSGLEIYRNVNYSYPEIHTKTWESALLRDCMMFGMWWRENVHSHLNGFCGFDCIKVELDPALNMKLDIKF